MTINYIPNDPLAGDQTEMRRHTPRADRPRGRAGFTYSNVANEGRYAFGTPEFLFWQCSESALAAMEMWEKIDAPLRKWADSRRNLELRQNAGRDLNAYYDRRSLSFFEYKTGQKTTYSGASTDVVAHEAGHACLDAIRPDLWNSFYTEVGAFHEAFGDCMAILTALDDRKSREKLIAESPWLWDVNFLEATAEDLSDGVRRELGASHPAAKPRHALNWFNWQLPTTLPYNGAPHVLTAEIHSFGRIFSGCFYDLIAVIFGRESVRGQAALHRAAQTAGKLLVAGTRMAPEAPRFFKSVGQAMMLADEQLNSGAHRQAIFTAFSWHNVSLASDSMLAPTTMVAGGSPAFASTSTANVTAATRRDVMARIGGKGRVKVRRVDIAGQRVAQMVHEREVPLVKLDSRLRGVVAVACEPVLLGRSGNHAAVLGDLPDATATADEVSCFVSTLLDHDLVEFGKRKGKGIVQDTSGKPTHAIRKSGSKKVLRRLRVSCCAG